MSMSKHVYMFIHPIRFLNVPFKSLTMSLSHPFSIPHSIKIRDRIRKFMNVLDQQNLWVAKATRAIDPGRVDHARVILMRALPLWFHQITVAMTAENHQLTFLPSHRMQILLATLTRAHWMEMSRR
jgi:hypothetical protein